MTLKISFEFHPILKLLVLIQVTVKFPWYIYEIHFYLRRFYSMIYLHSPFYIFQKFCNSKLFERGTARTLEMEIFMPTSFRHTKAESAIVLADNTQIDTLLEPLSYNWNEIRQA